MICKQRKMSSAEVSVEVFHSPDGGLHLQQVGRVVLLMLYQLPAGVSNDLMLSSFVNLSQDCTKTPGRVSSDRCLLKMHR